MAAFGMRPSSLEPRCADHAGTVGCLLRPQPDRLGRAGIVVRPSKVERWPGWPNAQSTDSLVGWVADAQARCSHR